MYWSPQSSANSIMFNENRNQILQKNNSRPITDQEVNTLNNIFIKLNRHPVFYYINETNTITLCVEDSDKVPQEFIRRWDPMEIA